MTVPSVRLASSHDVEACVGILASLPDYFTPDTHDKARQGFTGGRAWVAVEGETVVGFVLVEQRYPRSAEITWAAVRREHHNTGVGTALVEAAIESLAESGIDVVEVKTLDASADYEPYVATRAFWEGRGFVQVDCIDPYADWQPGNPAAIYVAAVRPTR